MRIEKEPTRGCDAAFQFGGQKRFERLRDKMGISGAEVVSHHGSLFRLAGADAVKKQTTRAEQGGGCFEQGQLNPGQADQVCRTATPFQLRQAADHAEAAAGSVNQDPVRRLQPGRTDAGAVSSNCFNYGQS